MATKTTEQNTLIATRVPPGDRWMLTNDSKRTIHTSLTEAIEAFFMSTKTKCEYRLAPLDSKLYAITTVTEEIIPTPPKGFNIYGDPI